MQRINPDRGLTSAERNARHRARKAQERMILRSTLAGILSAETLKQAKALARVGLGLPPNPDWPAP